MTESPFVQEPPTLGNQYTEDPALRSYLARVLPADALADIEPELHRMGELAASMYAEQLEDRTNEPVLTSWNPWGDRIDQVELTPLWNKAARIAATSGLVATAYERRHGSLARVHQFALAYLFGASSDVYTCPLAMTDGAASALLASGNQRLIDRAVPRLTSRDPDQMWTSGQWMTEATGGSDVSRTETVARRDEQGGWRLWGRKWFTSAVTSPMALTLAQAEGGGLALFYLETRDADGRLANIEVHRLKDKLGTRKVPTAELSLRGTPAIPVVGVSEGVRHIAPMLNVTRTWNAVQSVATMRRAVALAKSYSKKRVAFGDTLSNKPLHTHTLAGLQAELEAGLHLAFFVTEKLGLDPDEDPAGHRLLRLLTPIAKLTTAKQAVRVTSEVLESFGGAGYVEDTGLPMLLRDAQVLPIWEGTTNVLSLDVLRVVSKNPSVVTELRDFAVDIAQSTAQLQHPAQVAVEAIERSIEWLRTTGAGGAVREAGARGFALTLGRATALALLVRQAEWAAGSGDARGLAAAARFSRAPIDHLSDEPLEESRILASG